MNWPSGGALCPTVHFVDISNPPNGPLRWVTGVRKKIKDQLIFKKKISSGVLLNYNFFLPIDLTHSSIKSSSDIPVCLWASLPHV